MNPAAQTRRLYAWENGIPPTKADRDQPMRALRRLAARVARDHHRAPPVVVAGRWWDSPTGLVSYNDGDLVVLKRNHRTKWVLLHELAHWLQGERGRVHGPAFARRLILLLERYAGEDRLYLELSAKAAGVKL